MKRTITFLIWAAMLLMWLAGCERKGFKKPFVIVYKQPNALSCGDGYCGYQFIDANKSLKYFCETVDKYNIGDTIR